MPDFRVATNWLTHPKTLDGIAEWGEPFIARIIRLWAHTSDHYPDGDLKRMSKRALGMICQCDDPRFPTWLIENGWIDETETGMSVHDWAVHQPWLSKTDERSEQARINGKIGAAKRWGSEPIATPIDPAKRIHSEPIATPIDPAKRIHSEPIAPSPSPSPSPEEKIKKEEKNPPISPLTGGQNAETVPPDLRPVSEIPQTREQTAQLAAVRTWDECWQRDPITGKRDPSRGGYLESKRGERTAREEICAALGHDVSRIESAIERFFADDDPWLQGKRNWHTLRKKLNEYREPKKEPSPTIRDLTGDRSGAVERFLKEETDGEQTGNRGSHQRIDSRLQPAIE